MFDKSPPPNMRKLPFLPEEILVDEILARLPVKSLSRFKYVSKSWLTLIESDRFILIHYRNSARNPRVIALNPEPRGIKIGDYLQSLLDSKEGPVPTKIEPNIRVRLLCCCNGVLCCSDYLRGRLSLWNPAIGVSIELPNAKGQVFTKWGFGRDELSGAYKVFAVWSACRFSEVRSGWVYSSITNSWRKSPGGSDSAFLPTGLFPRGNLHWTGWSLPQIEAFDLGREEFGRIELPLKDEVRKKSHSLVLGVIGGSLALVLDVEKRLDVWVMKEYGVKDSWLKILTFPTTALSDPRIFCFPLFGEGPNGEIFRRL